jgi:hypothetical protein
MITCGNCHGKHNNVDEVRNCFANGKPTSYGTTVTVERDAALPEFATDPATIKQLDYINALLEQRDSDLVGGRPGETIMDVMGGKQISKREASALIGVLKACPGKAVAAANNETIAASKALWPAVPAGRYAIYKDGVLRFYQVDKPESGRWAGRVFLSLLIGSPGSWTRLAIKNGADKNMIMDGIIAVGASNAAAEFGRKAGVCGRCLSPLSNVRSRAAGYGHVCAEKLGWPYPNEEDARRMLNEMGIDPDSIEESPEVGNGEFAKDNDGLEPEWTLS